MYADGIKYRQINIQYTKTEKYQKSHEIIKKRNKDENRIKKEIYFC